MNQFYTEFIKSNLAILSETESMHLRVLRLKEGDDILIVDGLGKQYKGSIGKIHKKASEVKNLSLIKEAKDQPLLDVAIAPTKSNDRFEWFLEKATEIGVRNIYPFISYHSERKVLKLDRMQKIIQGAMKQSLRLWLPQIQEIQSFNRLVMEKSNDHNQKFIAHLKTEKLHFKDEVDRQMQGLILIGPEGGFSDQEIELAETNGFKSVTLGNHRYRTETAGILACALFANS